MDFKARFKNPVFWIQIGFAIITPIFAYFGLAGEDITTWYIFGKTLCDAVQNPYVVFLVAVSVWQTFNNPTTKGLGDNLEHKDKVN